MSHRTVFAGLLLLVPVALGVAVAEDSSEMVTLHLPKGDPEAGRAAFQSLGCVKCHRVAGEKDFPRPVSATPGPALGAFLGQETDAEVGLAIFAPSHDIRAAVRGGGKVSPMTDFTETMTIGQFMDVIAYLREVR